MSTPIMRRCQWNGCTNQFDDVLCQRWLKITMETREPVTGEDDTKTVERLRATMWVCERCAEQYLDPQTTLHDLWDYFIPSELETVAE